MAACSRRNLLKLAGTGSLALLLPIGSRHGSTHAQQRLDPEDEQARALGYVHDTRQAERDEWPSHSPDQKCANCQLAQQGDGEWMGCSIFRNKLVNRNGWCSAWLELQG